MGQAKQRGSFEERKADAIASGRRKAEPKRKRARKSDDEDTSWLMGLAWPLLFGRKRRGKS